MKKLITERDVIDAWRRRQSKLFVALNGIVTPAAVNAAKTRNIEIVYGTSRTLQTSTPQLKANFKDSGKIIVGSDHGGFELKETILSYLQELGYETEDVGTFSTEPVDYPDFAHLVAKRVAKGDGSHGIIVDGAGVGSAMAANKVPGIRAAACYDIYTARNSREHNYANVLTLGSRVLGIDTAKEIVKTWLNTDYGAERHKRRVDKIMEIERKYRDS